MSDDELGKRRSGKQLLEATTIIHNQGAELAEGSGFSEFMEGMPVHEFGHQAQALAGAFVGTLVGTWIDAGATEDQVREYFTRFVDLVLQQYQQIKPHIPEGV